MSKLQSANYGSVATEVTRLKCQWTYASRWGASQHYHPLPKGLLSPTLSSKGGEGDLQDSQVRDGPSYHHDPRCVSPSPALEERVGERRRPSRNSAAGGCGHRRPSPWIRTEFTIEPFTPALLPLHGESQCGRFVNYALSALLLLALLCGCATSKPGPGASARRFDFQRDT